VIERNRRALWPFGRARPAIWAPCHWIDFWPRSPSRDRVPCTGFPRSSCPEDINIAQKKRILRNEEIEAYELRVIGDDSKQIGVMNREDALRTAKERGLDLVEVDPNATPPVCKILDYGRYVFEQNKRAHAARKRQKQIQVKEMKFRPGTEEGDYQVKLRNLMRFLDDGDKAKVSLRFRGREMAHPEIGLELLKRIENDLEEHGSVETAPKFEGRQMTMVLSARKRTKH
jgi:translation initiation factor IF-3